MRNSLFFSLVFLSLLSCNHKVDIRTATFNRYLKETFGLTLGKDIRNYVILPKDVGCTGCKKYALDYLLLQKNPQSTILICSEDIASSIPANNKFKVLIDTFGAIDKINLQTQNVAIIVTEDSKVTNIISVQPDEIDSIFKKYFTH